MGRGFTPTHMLWHTNARCGFSCGRSAHSDSDHHQQLPCLAHSRSPGITQRHWALVSSAVGREPAGLGDTWRAEGVIWEAYLLRRKEKKVDVNKHGEEEKVKGRVVGVNYHIFYHKQKFQVCLSFRGLRWGWELKSKCWDVLIEMRLHYGHCIEVLEEFAYL